MMVRQNRLIVLPWVQAFSVELHPDCTSDFVSACNLAFEYLWLLR